MKRNDIKELRHKSKEELQKEVVSLSQRIHKLELGRKTKPEKNFRLGSRLRDDIARVKTMLQIVGQKEKAKV